MLDHKSQIQLNAKRKIAASARLQNSKWLIEIKFRGIFIIVDSLKRTNDSILKSNTSLGFVRLKTMKRVSLTHCTMYTMMHLSNTLPPLFHFSIRSFYHSAKFSRYVVISNVDVRALYSNHLGLLNCN